MKLIFKTFLISLFCYYNLAAQEAPSTKEFEAAGVKVIARESVKGTVSARVFLLGGVANYPAEKQGVEEIMLTLIAEGGPASMEKQEYQRTLEKIGARINSSTGYDYSNISLNCIKPYWKSSWQIFSAAITDPAFRQEDFDLVKNKLITAAKQAKTNPDAHLSNLSMESAWEGTDYAKRPSGTAESLESLTLKDVKGYYNRLFGKDRVFVVVVGDLNFDQVQDFMAQSFEKLPQGTPPPSIYAGEKVEEGLMVEDRNIETNYIRGVFDAPMKGTDASIHNALAMRILGRRFFEELRTKRSLSYAPSARTTGYAARPMNQVYISTTDPEQSLEVMVDLVNQVRTDGFEKKELDGTKQTFLTNYYMGQETNSSISMSLGVNEIYGGWENMDRFTDRVLATELDDINSVMRTYGDEIHWTYLGKEELVKPKMFSQPVKAKKVKK